MDAVDDDTLAAIKALWLASTDLPALFDRAPETGRLKPDHDRARPTPYAQLECKFARLERYTKPIRKDVRTVTVTIYGTRAAVVAALAAVLEAFSSQMGAIGRPVLSYPSGAKFIAWRSTNSGEITEDTSTREGLDFWQGKVIAEVTSTRAE